MAAPEYVIVRKLQRLMKAYDRFARAVDGVEESEARLDREFEELVALVEGKTVPSLDQFLQNARRQVLADISSSSAKLHESEHILRRELAILGALRARRERLEWFYKVYLQSAGPADGCPATRQELAARLRALHESAKELIKSARPLSRKQKKRRKRNIGQGITSLIYGTGAFVLNANIAFVPSYVFGGGAFVQATRDFIGEKKD